MPSDLHRDEADALNAIILAALALAPYSDDGVVGRYFLAGILIEIRSRVEHLDPFSLLLELNPGNVISAIMIHSDS